MSKTVFLLNPSPTFKTTVSFAIPGGQTGSFKGEFKHKTSEQVKDFIERLKKMEDLEAVLEIMAGWDIGEPFNEENVQTLLSNYAAATREIFNIYFSEIYGTREGN